MNVAETIKIRGVIRLEIHRDGHPVEIWEEENLVVNNGKSNLARLLGDGGGSTRKIKQVGFGIGVAAAAPGDVGLTGATYKDVTVSYPTASQAVFSFTLEKSEGNGLNITEFGLIHENGNLFARKVRTAGLAKANDVRFVGTWTINF